MTASFQPDFRRCPAGIIARLLDFQSALKTDAPAAATYDKEPTGAGERR
jgi:hypothetical protein